MKQLLRLDAPFWLAVVAGLLMVGAVGCFGLAAALQGQLRGADIVMVGDT